ncbi:MAG: hypothetical protein AABY04_02320 [Candidatus Micrarchaeota archaeon]
MKTVEDKPVSFSYAKSQLEKRKKESELGYEQQNSLEYLEKFTVLTEAESEKLKKELEELNLLSDEQIIELINNVPSKEDLVKTILSKDKLEFPMDKIKEIAKITKKYAK